MTTSSRALVAGSALPRPASAHPRRHLAGLDGLRALAVIAVIVYHLFPDALPGGFIGVDVFFVISGFLITSLLVDERDRSGRISLRRFWSRRARRLLPALVALVLACCTAAWALGGDVLVGIGRQVIGAATFSSNWIDIVSGGSYFSQDAPELFRNLWSLAVEEQFYLVWPLIMIGLLVLRAPWLRAGLVAALGVASAAAMGLQFVVGDDPTRVYFGTDAHSFGLAVGATLALCLGRLRPFDLDAGETRVQEFVRRRLPIVGVLALAVVGFAAWWLHDDAALTYRGGLMAVSILTALVIWASVTPRSSLGRALDIAPLRVIGERSYGLYLWHWPVLLLVGAAMGLPPSSRGEGRLAAGVLTIAITAGAAFLSYRYLEQPIRRRGLRRSVRALLRVLRAPARRPLAAVCALVLIAGLAGTTVAVATAPRMTQAQALVERGMRAIHDHQADAPASARHGTSPGDRGAGSPSPGAGASSAAPTPGTGGAASQTDAAADGHHPLPPGTDISAIGDSVMLASTPELAETFPGISIDAVVSRQMRAAPDLVRAMAAAGTLRPVLVLGLGTNGPISEQSLDEVSRAAGPERKIVLVTAQAPRSWTDGVNSALVDFDRRRQQVAVADWHAAIASHIDLLAPDQIHPGQAGGRIYAATVRDALQRLVDQPPARWFLIDPHVPAARPASAAPTSTPAPTRPQTPAPPAG
ncbi:acyltransferase family protein [Microbacterium sp. STN6]|uniref:acyltransferase family protein n=1 Tax=Microbacterium sp. STN6 TaxID=2995588 RepID=UPI002260A2C1|nr:acyltransferase family protein [Microbacterium sp. STN6]MCX7523243.1 acyltransferase family protein [Microbacterium sp. STN6]